jgi:hypothetical protein
MNVERDTPRSRIPFVTGNCPLSKSKDTRSSAVRSSIILGNDRLRVICWKSAYLIFSVTVRPRAPDPAADVGVDSAQPFDRIRRSSVAIKLGACPSIIRILLAKDERVRF